MVPFSVPPAISRKASAYARSTARSARASTRSGYVPMGSTIVRTAAKLATFLLPTLVSTEPNTLCLKIDAVARFAAGAGGVAKFFAETAGLEGDAPQQLQDAVVAACEEAFDHLPSGRPLT